MLKLPLPYISWIENYLSDRSFQVRVKSSLSSPRSVTSDVPQGTVLGPLIFLLYTCDLPAALLVHNVEVKCYADDLKLYCGFTIDESRAPLQNALDALAKWSSCWQLPISQPKCCILHVGRANPQHPYTLSSLPLRLVSEIKDLGFLIDRNLKFSSHCKYISTKAFQVSHMILRALYSSHLTPLLSAYRIYVRPILESGTTVFSPYLKTDIQQLERVQNYFTRRIYKRVFNLSRPLLPSSKVRNSKLSLQTLKSRRDNKDLLMLYRLIYGHIRLSDKIPHHYSLKSSNLRGPGFSISIPYARQNYRILSFFPRSANMFLIQCRASTSHEDLLHNLSSLLCELRIS